MSRIIDVFRYCMNAHGPSYTLKVHVPVIEQVSKVYDTDALFPASLLIIKYT